MTDVSTHNPREEISLDADVRSACRSTLLARLHDAATDGERDEIVGRLESLSGAPLQDVLGDLDPELDHDVLSLPASLAHGRAETAPILPTEIWIVGTTEVAVAVYDDHEPVLYADLEALCDAHEIEYDDDHDALVEPGWYADDGNTEVHFPDADSGREAAEQYVSDGDWGSSSSTLWFGVCAWRAGIAKAKGGDTVRIGEDTHTVAVDPDAPDCEGDHEHDWCSPHSVLGGCESNPGVWGHGGGVIIREVCRHCGRYRVTDTWAQDPESGAQGLTSVRYDDADEGSTRWLAQRLLEDAEWHYESSPTLSDDRAVGCELRTPSGEVIAACLWTDGDLDIESDGCGVLHDDLDADSVDWPDEEDALRAVWPDEAVA